MKCLLPICLLAVSQFAFGVPTEINYQGCLTDGDGNPASGSKIFGLKIYDAATGGNELYSETIGSVVVDTNGIYNFQFGANGTSTVSVSETLVVTDGSSTTFDATPSSTPLDSTLSVTDSTYSWNEVDGNPGEQATATASLVNRFVVGITVNDGGSGYTAPPLVTINGNGTGATATAVVDAGVVTAIDIDTNGSGYTEATVTIADPPAPFVVDYSGGTLDFTYESAPAAGVEIVASYEANQSSLAGALAEADSHWLELTVDGNTQSSRERILSVPFAQISGSVAGLPEEFEVSLSSGWKRNNQYDNSEADLPLQEVTERGDTSASFFYNIKPEIGLKKLIKMKASMEYFGTYNYAACKILLQRHDPGNGWVTLHQHEKLEVEGLHTVVTYPNIEFDFENFGYRLLINVGREYPSGGPGLGGGRIESLKVTFSE